MSDTIYGDTDSLFIDLNLRVNKYNLHEVIQFAEEITAKTTSQFKEALSSQMVIIFLNKYINI